MEIEAIKSYSGMECKVECKLHTGTVLTYYGVIHVQNSAASDSFGDIVVVENNWTNSCVAVDVGNIINIEVLKS